jgi:hypothetical protein
MLMEDLARLGARGPAEVLRDVKATATDVVRLGIDSPLTRDGRIPVEAGRRVYEAARNLLLASACSVLDPRPVYASRKPEEAMDVLRNARFGQTEVGSFVLSIECSVPPRLSPSAEPDEDDPGAPLERRTCMMLAQALASAETASRESAASNKLEPFRDRVDEGVSANLCEAVAELFAAAEADRLRAAFSFASRRPVRQAITRNVVFSADRVELLREAARELRLTSVLPAIEAEGPVVRLSSPLATYGGDIVMQAVIEGRSRTLRVHLEADDYQKAVTAHRDGALLRCTGDLAREGRSWVLRNPRGLAIRASSDDE